MKSSYIFIIIFIGVLLVISNNLVLLAICITGLTLILIRFNVVIKFMGYFFNKFYLYNLVFSLILFLTFKSIYFNNINFNMEILAAALLMYLTIIIYLRFTKLAQVPLIGYLIFFSLIQSYFLTLDISIKLNIEENDQSSIHLISKYSSIILITTTFIAFVNMHFLSNRLFYINYLLGILNISDCEKFIVSVHEVSHFIAFCFFKNPPLKLEILLFKNAKKINPSVNGIFISTSFEFSSKEYYYWKMLICLSGSVGESIIMNKKSEGSISDYREWDLASDLYLTKYEPEFKKMPKSFSEKTNNDLIKNRLYSENIAMIESHLILNKKLLTYLSSKALINNKLNPSELNYYYSKIKFNKNFPRELG